MGCTLPTIHHFSIAYLQRTTDCRLRTIYGLTVFWLDAGWVRLTDRTTGDPRFGIVWDSRFTTLELGFRDLNLALWTPDYEPSVCMGTRTGYAYADNENPPQMHPVRSSWHTHTDSDDSGKRCTIADSDTIQRAIRPRSGSKNTVGRVLHLLWFSRNESLVVRLSLSLWFWVRVHEDKMGRWD